MAEYVDIDLDHATVGCGMRRALVLTKGPKWVKLFYPASLSSITIPRLMFDTARPLCVIGYSCAKLAKRIRRNVAQATRLQMWDGGAAANDALDCLRD